MNKDWHSGHFCCWQCDESLTGHRYVLRDEHPYCIKCYENGLYIFSIPHKVDMSHNCNKSKYFSYRMNIWACLHIENVRKAHMKRSSSFFRWHTTKITKIYCFCFRGMLSFVARSKIILILLLKFVSTLFLSRFSFFLSRFFLFFYQTRSICKYLWRMQ